MTDKLWFAARKGSSLAYWKPDGLLLGIIESHPDHPPIMHWLGGESVELKCTADGLPIVEVPNPNCPITIAVGVPEGMDEPAFINFVEIDPPSIRREEKAE